MLSTSKEPSLTLQTPLNFAVEKNGNGGIVRQRVQPTRAPSKKWTKQEDYILLSGVMEYINANKTVNYREIVNRLPNRNVRQSKERWTNSLNPNLKKGAWSNDELVRLLSEIEDKGQNWTVIQRVISNRSMHCIKIKSKKLLGETLTKRLQRLTKRKQTIWTKEEIDNMIFHHKEGLKQCKMLDVKDKDLIIEFEKHENFEVLLEKICIELGTGRPIAQIDRKLIEICSCSFCSYRKACICKLDKDFKFGWTKRKAILLRQTYQPLPRIPIKIEDVIDLSHIPQDNVNDRYSSVEEDIDFDLDYFIGDSALNNTIQVQQTTPRSFYTNTTKNESHSNYIESFDHAEDIILDFLSTPPSTPISEASSRKRQSSNNSYYEPVRSLRRVEYSEDTEIEQFFNDLSSSLYDRQRLLNQYSDDVDDSANILTMVQNYERTKPTSNSGLAKKLVEVMASVFGKERFQCFVQSMNTHRHNWLTPAVCKIIDDIKPNASRDPRLSKDYLAPTLENARFDHNLPIGKLIINFVTKIIKDDDCTARMIARGPLMNKHIWQFIPDNAEAVLRLYYLMPLLQKHGEARTYLRFFRRDGTMGVFLVHHKIISTNPFMIKVRLQDVSHRMQHILTLPDIC